MDAQIPRTAWLVGYFPHHGKIQKSEEVVNYWYRHRTIEEAADTARWLIGALGAAPDAATDSERELAEFHTPHLPAGGGVGWRVGPYEVALQDWGPLNKPDALNPMGRLIMVAEELNRRRIHVTVSGYAARSGIDLTSEVQTLLSWDVAELSGALPRLSSKGRDWLNTFGDWKVTWYSHFAGDRNRKYFMGDEGKARAYADHLKDKQWRNVYVESPLDKTDIIASDVLDIH